MASVPLPRLPRRRLNIWLFGTLLLCFVFFLPRPGDWNQDARLDTIFAIVNHRTVAVDEYRWNAPLDVVRYGGHYYASKAPGQALIGVPIFALYKGALTLSGHQADTARIGLASSWKQLYANFYVVQILETIYTVAIPAAIFLMLFFWFLGYFTESLANRLILTLALGLATDYVGYAQVFYPHDNTAACVFASFMLLYMAGRGVRGEPARAPRLEGRPELAVFLSGICLGLAVFLDHTAVIPGAVIVAYALIRVPPRMLLFLALGGAPAAAAVLAYDKFAFQNAGVTGYSTNWSGVGGSPAGKTVHDSALWGMSFSPSRGLFFLSPFLLLAFPGLYLWRKRGGWEWLVCLLAPVALFGFVSTIYYWPGGTSLGPRYLIEILPLLALPIVFVLDRVRSGPLRLGIYALIVLSFVNVWIEMTGAAGYPAPEIANPIFDYSIPHLLRGDVPLTLGAVLLAPFTGIHSKWTLLPLPVMIALWTLYCARPTRRRAHEERPSRLQATPESPGAP